ncbi:MAG: pyridoxamine 5'-phosphate oxidase [Myxococcales bacterium]|nr:pyridoxamine 5'-phosphate oxidase [Myxococcales bacterium]
MWYRRLGGPRQRQRVELSRRRQVVPYFGGNSDSRPQPRRSSIPTRPTRVADSPSISQLRRSYEAGTLDVGDVEPDPLAQLRAWVQDAVAASAPDASAMTLSTLTSDGAPTARVVLLKAVDDRGAVFYTNQRSAKGEQLARDPRAALSFFWATLERQVRLEGTVERVTDAEADAYFATRPRDSQLGAWASNQSQPVASRADLEAAMADADARFPDVVPRPPHWGGYRLLPHRVELWQGRAGRLHDRVEYRRQLDGWRLRRLAP